MIDNVQVIRALLRGRGIKTVRRDASSCVRAVHPVLCGHFWDQSVGPNDCPVEIASLIQRALECAHQWVAANEMATHNICTECGATQGY